MTENGKYIIAIRVYDRFGVLTRVSSLFSRRGFNIESICAGKTETPGVTRITVTMRGDVYAKNQIIKQLTKLTEVCEVAEMPADNSVARELLQIKVNAPSEKRRDIMDACSVFRANIVDFSLDSVIISMTGESTKLDAFIDLMQSFGILELCRTGIVALERGSTRLCDTDMNYVYSLEQG